MGTKSSKNNTYNNQPLSAETIHELCEDTGFSEEELLAWHAYVFFFLLENFRFYLILF